jgi:hypothetical protein
VLVVCVAVPLAASQIIKTEKEERGRDMIKPLGSQASPYPLA